MIWLRHSAARRIALVAFGVYAAAMLLGAAVYYAAHAAFSRQIAKRGAGQRRADRAISSRRAGGPFAPSPAAKPRSDHAGHRAFWPRRAAAGGRSPPRPPRPAGTASPFSIRWKGATRARQGHAAARRLPAGGGRDLEDLEAIDRAILAILPSPCWRNWRWAWGAPVLARYLRGKLAGIEDTASASGAIWPPRRRPAWRRV
jgi:hypothetical protein